jgi:hypothetical protein
MTGRSLVFLPEVTSPLRLLVYDRTCGPPPRLPVGLSTAWRTGSWLYRGLGRLDAAAGVASWREALEFLAGHAPTRPLAEVQYWGHGRWGRVLCDREPLDATVLGPAHPLHGLLGAVKERLLPEALVWLRTCEAFGTHAGQDFARRLADGLGVRVAGHTHIIGFFQSGLHGLRPGELPAWSPEEGLAEGTASAPVRAHDSSPLAPRTITCLHGRVPEGWFR